MKMLRKLSMPLLVIGGLALSAPAHAITTEYGELHQEDDGWYLGDQYLKGTAGLEADDSDIIQQDGIIVMTAHKPGPMGTTQYGIARIIHSQSKNKGKILLMKKGITAGDTPQNLSLEGKVLHYDLGGETHDIDVPEVPADLSGGDWR